LQENSQEFAQRQRDLDLARARRRDRDRRQRLEQDPAYIAARAERQELARQVTLQRRAEREAERLERQRVAEEANRQRAEALRTRPLRIIHLTDTDRQELNSVIGCIFPMDLPANVDCKLTNEESLSRLNSVRKAVMMKYADVYEQIRVNPLRPYADYLQDANGDAEEAVLAYRADYSGRLFEIETMTMSAR